MTFLNLLLLIVIILLILVSGFLSGSETAITATSEARIISKIKKGNQKAKYVKMIIDDKDSIISSLLLSNNLVNILASSLATAFFYDLFGLTGIFYATLLMTFLLVIFAEVLPKTYSINKPTRTALIIAPTIYYLNKILLPFVFLINKIVNLIIRNKDQKDLTDSDEQSEEELQGVIDLYQTSNPDSEHEKEMLQSILKLNDTIVEEVFTHRKNIYSIDINLGLDEIIKKINLSKFTRIPFWKNNPENIIGLLNIRSLDININNYQNDRKTILDKMENISREMVKMKSGVLNTDSSKANMSPDSIYSVHMADAGTDSHEREKSFLFLSREDSYYRNLENALERIDSEAFGVCQICGELIPEDRMMEVLNATKCVDCKTRDKLNL